MKDVNHELLKSEKMQTILRVRAKILQAVRNWFERHGFIHVQTPILVPVSQELESSSLRVRYFDKEAHLAQGACPYLEALMARLGKVYTITPAFRAERSSTMRHLTEFWRVECLAPTVNLADIMKVMERLIMSICRYLSKEAAEELHILKKDLSSINAPFPRISYSKAIEVLQEDGISIFWGRDLEADREEHLSQKFHKPFFVSHFPLGAETFFFKSCPQETELALVADLLAPEGYGEIATCGEMIDDYEGLLKKLKTEKIDEKTNQWRLELKRSVPHPHSGFAIGIERLLMWICGLKHIEETTMFPRAPQLDLSDGFLNNALTCSR
jgi:asparaginyl-tRNA synthetase